MFVSEIFYLIFSDHGSSLVIEMKGTESKTSKGTNVTYIKL